jgi:hypothetical protein
VSLAITTDKAGPAFAGNVVLATVPNGKALFHPPAFNLAGWMQGHFGMGHFG